MRFLALKIPPVLQVVVIGAAMYGVSKTMPAMRFSLAGSAWLGGAIAVTGLGIAVMGVTEFKNTQTTVNPQTPEKSEHLVTSGVYRYSRNPMYVGLVFILFGWALYRSHALAFALLPVFVIYMSRFQIQAEEKVMTQKFGEAYITYLSQVRRWL